MATAEKTSSPIKTILLAVLVVAVAVLVSFQIFAGGARSLPKGEDSGVAAPVDHGGIPSGQPYGSVPGKR